jgi:hypothetical protein
MHTSFRHFAGLAIVLTSTVLIFLPPGAHAQQSGAPAESEAVRDGQHDFDFNLGVWKSHIRRVLHPLAASSETIELTGRVTVRKVWGGRAQLEEIEADGPLGHWEGLTLFTYNLQAHQWIQSYANAKDGVIGTPLIGSFGNGQLELYSQDTLDGRTILVRGTWSHIEPNSHQYEESYSGDGGRTWATAFSATVTRESA